MYCVNKIEVTLNVPSIEDTVAWYHRVLGWVGHHDVFDAEGHCQFGSVMCGDSERVLHGEEEFRGFNLSRDTEGEGAGRHDRAGFMAMITVDNVDAVYEQVMVSGAASDGAPENQVWGGRTFMLRDLNGCQLMFVQQVETVTLEEVRRRIRERQGGAA